MPINKDDKRKLAEIYYIEHGMNDKDIADKLTIDPRTVGKWADKHKWDDRRLAFQTGHQKTLETLNSLLQVYADKLIELEQDEEADNSKEKNRVIDQITKLNKTINSLRNDKPTLRVYLHCIGTFMDALRLHSPEIFMKLLEFQEEHVIKQAELLK